MHAKFIITFLAGTVLLILSLQNPQTLRLKFIVWKTPDLSLLVILLASGLLGMVFGFLIGHPWKRSARRAPKESDDQDHSGNE
ncbi:MAG TPA: LapA family protein [Elusimicrobiota bacterium]|nr:LapA family protein [Elusimicrobiota bacterium]